MNTVLETDTTASSVTNHPLDPPTKAEVDRGAELAKSALNDRAAFCTVALEEPPKEFLRHYKLGQSFGRKLRFTGYDHPSQDSLDGGFDALVDLGTESVEVRRIKSGQAPIGWSDVVNAVRIIKADPTWLAAMKKRGITDIENVQIDPWPAGGYQHPSIPEGHRAHRGVAFVREDKTDNNGYARPVQGLIAHVDLTAGRVAHVEDHGATPLPPESGRYDAASQPTLREPLNALEIKQPDGPGFRISGHQVTWNSWQFRVGLHPINGLVLYELTYNDDGRIRSILRRAALSDMVVPYGDTDPMHVWKHVLDAGEAAIGNATNSLRLGCDCLGEIRYLDHVCVGPDGAARVIERAICIHEEDYGVLWKHHDGTSKTTEVRRSRRLVVSSFHTVGNYEYGFYWYIYLDGTIQMEVKLTGIVGVSAVLEENERPEFAPLIAPGLASPVHQHLFCFRLDFEIDGATNRVYELNTEALVRSSDNPDGTAFHTNATLLETTVDAQRDVDHAKARCWKIVNPKAKNRLNRPVGYRLVPGVAPTLMARPESKVAQRATFALHNLWVTPYADGQLCAAGDFPNLNPGLDGLPMWSEANEDIVDKDIVVWHTTGVTHLPRPEDWPVMPVEYCGFTLHPVGFFDRNPAINLPPEHH